MRSLITGVVNLVLCGIAMVFMLFLGPEIAPNLVSPELRGTIIYTCLSYTIADSLCRVYVHKTVGPIAAKEDGRCMALGVGVAATVASPWVRQFHPSTYDAREPLVKLE